MRTTMVLLVVCALAVVVGAMLAPGPAAAEDDSVAAFEWHTDLDVARAKARKSGKPILAVFT